jgi:hypothetical protein
VNLAGVVKKVTVDKPMMTVTALESSLGFAVTVANYSPTPASSANFRVNLSGKPIACAKSARIGGIAFRSTSTEVNFSIPVVDGDIVTLSYNAADCVLQ